MKTTELESKFMEHIRTQYGFTLRKAQLQAARTLAIQQKHVHMGTGEGKTISAALAAVLFASEGRRVYVVTVNDYLAERDFSQFEDIFSSLGYTAVLNTHVGSKAVTHAADIIYTSVQNLLFDYVANEFNPQGVQFDLNVAILDEIDYVLLDSANTRFSVTCGDTTHRLEYNLLDMLWELTAQLGSLETVMYAYEGGRYETEQEQVSTFDCYYNAAKKQLAFTEQGLTNIENTLRITPDHPQYCDLVSLCHTSLMARLCYHRDIDYSVEADGMLSVINPYNGRANRNAAFEFQLDYFLRRKEQIRFANTAGLYTNTMSAPILFRKFKTVVGMSGTAKQAREELGVLTGVGTQTVRTSWKLERKDVSVQHFEAKAEKLAYIRTFIDQNRDKHAFLLLTENDQEAKEFHAALSDLPSVTLLTNEQLADEQVILDKAGQCGHVLISTPLAGRGTDIIVRDAPCGLAVLMTFMGDSLRVELQGRGRAGRCGQVGFSTVLISSEDITMAHGDMPKRLTGRYIRFLQRKQNAALEAHRAVSLCEEILFENAKTDIMTWVNNFEGLSPKQIQDEVMVLGCVELCDTLQAIPLEDDVLCKLFCAVLQREFVPCWLDFRRSLEGRLLVPFGSFEDSVHKACVRMGDELKGLQRDIVGTVVRLCSLAEITY